MTLMTEKDKKLLIVVGVCLGVFLLVFVAVWPLWTSGNEIAEQIPTQETEKQEKELKVSQYPILQVREQTMLEETAALKSSYYEVMKSAEVDREMTSFAVAHGVVAKNLSITMPDTESTDSYVSLSTYNAVIGTADADEAGTSTFSGVYAVTISMDMIGTSAQLQQVIDDLYEMEPKLRLVSYNWNVSELNDADSALSISAQLYMCQDIDEYIESQLAAQEAAAEEGTAEESTDDTDTDTDTDY